MPTIAQVATAVKSRPIIGTDQATPKIQPSTAFAPQSRSIRPDCFVDHHAPKSVGELFEDWVRAADQTDNGVISINLRRQRYGHTTTAKAIAWLVKHRLLVKVERGGGRGNASRYFVRWSFTHETLSTRQNAVNHPEYRITVHLDTFARVEAYKLLEEKPQSKKHSSYKYETFTNVLVSESKKTIVKGQNSKKRRLRNERATRWALARLREGISDKDALTASSKSIRRALATGQVFIGSELNRFVRDMLSWIQDHEETGWEDGAQATFSFIGFAAQEAISMISWERMKWAERQTREIEREEARQDPIGSFSCRDYNNATRGIHARTTETDTR